MPDSSFTIFILHGMGCMNAPTRLVCQYILRGKAFEKCGNLYIKNVQYEISKRQRGEMFLDKEPSFGLFVLKHIGGFNLRTLRKLNVFVGELLILL